MKILVAYAPTPEGERALARGMDDAERESASLLIVRAVPMSSGENTSAARGKARDMQAERDRMAALVETATQRGIAATGQVEVIDHSASVSEAVIALADREEVDLLVVGVRRRSPVGKAVLGSDAQDILLNANCPVLAVKAD